MVGIEHIDELVQTALRNVQADDPELLSSGRIKLVGESGVIKKDCPLLVCLSANSCVGIGNKQIEFDWTGLSGCYNATMFVITSQ